MLGLPREGRRVPGSGQSQQATLRGQGHRAWPEKGEQCADPHIHNGVWEGLHEGVMAGGRVNCSCAPNQSPADALPSVCEVFALEGIWFECPRGIGLTLLCPPHTPRSLPIRANGCQQIGHVPSRATMLVTLRLTFFLAPSSVFRPSRCVGCLPSSQRKASLQEERRNLQAVPSHQRHIPMMVSSLSPRVLSSRHTQVPASLVSNHTTAPFIGLLVLNSSVYWSLVHRLQIQKIHFIARFKIGSAVSHTGP